MNKLKPKQILSITFILVSVGSLYFVPWLLVKAWLLPLPNTVQAEVNQAVEYGFEGVIVYVDKANITPQYYTAGWHNRELKIPTRPDALFKIASIGKLYNAVAVTKLVSKGRLDLDKSLAQYLPELSTRIENAHKITLRHLVQHKSGIPNYTNAPNFWAAPTQSYQESLDLILDKAANFKPGEDYEYCNTNYLLINKIMDNELGYNNFLFTKKEILAPLGLTNTFSSLAEVDLEKVMSGYHLGHEFDLKTDEFGMLATAKDLGTFIRALNDGSLFKDGEKEIYNSIYKYEHSGWVPGYQSFAAYNHELDAIIITFYNTTDPKLYYWNLSEIINSRIVKILEKENQEK